MEIKVGRKYSDTSFGEYFILTILEVNGYILSYHAYDVGNMSGNDYVFEMTVRDFLSSGYEPLYTEVKATRLARKMFPNAEEKDGMLLLEE